MVIGALVIVASIELHASPAQTHQKAQKESSVVLELFTSQGCSSCPPADELLKRVQHESATPVIAISYHVDYWNYIGWEDPFSSSTYTEKQSSYNRKFGSRSNYTPQLVVNGKEHLVGSDASKLYSRISSYSSNKPQNEVRIQGFRKETDHIVVNYGIEGATEDMNIRAVLVIEQRDTYVKRGENRNRKLSNSNIAVSEKRDLIETENGSIKLSIPKIVQQEDKLRIVVLVENQDMDIMAAVQSGSFIL